MRGGSCDSLYSQRGSKREEKGALQAIVLGGGMRWVRGLVAVVTSHWRFLGSAGAIWRVSFSHAWVSMDPKMEEHVLVHQPHKAYIRPKPREKRKKRREDESDPPWQGRAFRT